MAMSRKAIEKSAHIMQMQSNGISCNLRKHTLKKKNRLLLLLLLIKLLFMQKYASNRSISLRLS